MTNKDIWDIVTKELTSIRNILVWRDAHRGHDSCFMAASANWLMYLIRVRRFAKLEFSFLLLSHFSKYKNSPGDSFPIGRTVNVASFYFQHSSLSFEQGALCATPQRLMKSLELVSLDEEVESNRNMSCTLLITTLIMFVKMNSGALHLQQLQTLHTDGC